MASPDALSPSAPPTLRPPRLVVHGTDAEEAQLFRILAPRYGVDLSPPEVRSMAGAPLPAAGADSVSVDHRTRVSASDLAALRVAGVQHLCTRSIGLDHVDLAAAAELGVTVENVPYGPGGVADFTVMLILLAVRNAGALADPDLRHDPRLGRVRGRDLGDLTVGVVGLGPIGRAVVRRLEGFGCRLLSWSRSGRTVPAAAPTGLDDLLRASDVVTLHLPLVPDTHHLLGPDRIGLMKKGAVLVNTGRGALVDTVALADALERGDLGGAALDVVEGEHLSSLPTMDHGPDVADAVARLRRRPDVVITPHAAYHTRRMLQETVEGTLERCRSAAGRTDR